MMWWKFVNFLMMFIRIFRKIFRFGVLVSCFCIWFIMLNICMVLVFFLCFCVFFNICNGLFRILVDLVSFFKVGFDCSVFFGRLSVFLLIGCNGFWRLLFNLNLYMMRLGCVGLMWMVYYSLIDLLWFGGWRDRLKILGLLVVGFVFLFLMKLIWFSRLLVCLLLRIFRKLLSVNSFWGWYLMNFCEFLLMCCICNWFLVFLCRVRSMLNFWIVLGVWMGLFLYCCSFLFCFVMMVCFLFVMICVKWVV